MIYLIAEGLGFGHIARASVLYRELRKKERVRCFSYGMGAKLASEDVVFEPLPFEFRLKEEVVNEDNLFAYLNKISMRELSSFVRGFREDDVSAVVIDGSAVALLLCAVQFEGPIYFITNDLAFSVFSEKSWVKRAISGFPIWVVRRCERIFIPDFPPPYSISYRNNVSVLAKLSPKDLTKIEHVGPLVRVPSLKKTGRKVFLSNAPDFAGVLRMLQSSGMPFTAVPSPRSVPREKYLELLDEASVVIHHGGHSSVMESILLGKPQIVIYDPGYPERANNALGVEALGLGVALNTNELNPRVLEKAVFEALDKKPNVLAFSSFAHRFSAPEHIARVVVS